MTYYIAVWEGSLPPDDAAAVAEDERRYLEYEATRSSASPRLMDFVSRLLMRYPDLGDLNDSQVDEAAWTDGPLVRDVNGTYVLLPVRESCVAEIVPFIAEEARSSGLVAFDVQARHRLWSQPLDSGG